MTTIVPGQEAQAGAAKVPAIEVPKLWNKRLAAQRELTEASEEFAKADKRLAEAMVAFDAANAEYMSVKSEVHQ